MMLDTVAPFAGAWIEIKKNITKRWEHLVAPFAGAWIEIIQSIGQPRNPYVAPFAGAWIEIFMINSKRLNFFSSLPSRERGLK